ncbi:hypothetical protein EUX98_g872 [Antrodiella citrinella]|uniref:Ubiquitin 3 binding protein But2 C-terminal domain-containing protein n=1 Tax=Antrodiella citrinella TaxID=2447956 RepID=A0A4S4N2W6_9APHY|nr:hypothetical protein EUX98_g872 [Antrodiella citrinella]
MARLRAQHVLMSCIGFVFFLNLLIWSYFLIREWRKADFAPGTTYVGDDYPVYFPVRATPPVAQVMEESVHYLIDGDDARDNWALSVRRNYSLHTALGLEHRSFAVGMAHQMHCLRLMRLALTGIYDEKTQGHFTHCLHYIRQMTLKWRGLEQRMSAKLNIAYLVAFLQPKNPSWSDVDQHEVASSYIAFEEAYKSGRYNVNGTNVPPTMVFPLVLAQLNQSDPDKSYIDTHSFISRIGTIYPSDRHVLVSPKESTIAQFYAGDYGMERCTIKIMFPELNAQILPSGSASIQVWRVKAQRKLDIHSLSWKKRPERESIVASWKVHNNQTMESAEFVCPSGSYQTFELACGGSSNDCGTVDFRQETRMKTIVCAVLIPLRRVL